MDRQSAKQSDYPNQSQSLAGKLARLVSNSAPSRGLADRWQSQLENIRNTPTPTSALGAWSLVGLTAVVSLIAWYFGGFSVMLADLPTFLTGGAFELTRGNHIFAGCMAAVVLSIATAVASAAVVSLVVGNDQGEHAVARELANMTPGNQFGSLLFVVLLEEIFARGLFLGLLTRIPFLDGPVGFYAMFLLGNALWAAVHLTNFTRAEDRNLWRVLPQFAGGVIITYVYLKYGFLMGVVVHLGYDALLFSVHKREPVTGKDMGLTIYAGVAALVAYLCLSKPLTDLSVWVQDGESVFTVPGWGFWDYFGADICLTMTFSFFAGILLLDRPLAVAVKEEDKQKYNSFAFIAFAVALRVLMLYGLYWMTGWFTSNMDVRAVLVGLLIACLERGRSGSSVARSFWCTIPTVFLSLCVLEAVGFWQALAIVLLGYVVQLPMRVMNRD